MRKRNLCVFAVFTLASMMSSVRAARAAEDECAGTRLTANLVAENDSGVTGKALLCITDAGVEARIHASALTTGNAYTMWFIYFDNPSKCVTPGSCSDLDAFTPTDDPEGVFGRFDSIVAHARSATFSGHGGLHLSSGSVVSLEIVAHGVPSEDGKHRARQLLTPQIPVLGAPGLGTSVDGTVGNPVAAAQFILP